jgi:GDP-4-dehydro-6-deoxy-D-mannose reductase
MIKNGDDESSHSKMHNQRVLITGVCGFTGRHMVAHLCRHSPATIVGTDVCPDTALPVDTYLPCDLTDQASVDRLVAASQPSVVYHLAGLMGKAPVEELLRVNVGGFKCLTDSLRRWACEAASAIRVVTVGSAAELGSKGATRLPVVEEAECEPDSPYGQSKWEVTRSALAEPPDGPLQIVVARPFNLVGPGLSPQLALGSFARQIASIVRGEGDAVRCGPLHTRRDFVDVRDAVAAYVALAQNGRAAQVYNVCVGRSYKLERLLNTLVTLANVKVRIVCDSARQQPGDLTDIYGDHSKITREVGWRASISIERSLTDLLAAA